MYFMDIFRRISGFSTPVFGISWNPPEDERKTIRQLMLSLEDRRALYDPYPIEVTGYVIRSVLDMRGELLKTCQAIGEESKALPYLKGMLAACRKFLNTEGVISNRWPVQSFFIALGELRATSGLHIAHLCTIYGIDLEGEILSILPTVEELPD